MRSRADAFVQSGDPADELVGAAGCFAFLGAEVSPAAAFFGRFRWDDDWQDAKFIDRIIREVWPAWIDVFYEAPAVDLRDQRFIGSWIENALREDQLVPFALILCDESTDHIDKVVPARDLMDDDPRWRVEPSLVISKQPDAFVDAFRPLIRISSRLLLVDPVFRPCFTDGNGLQRPSFWIPTLEKLFRACAEMGTVCRLELHVRRRHGGDEQSDDEGYPNGNVENQPVAPGSALAIIVSGGWR